MAVLRFFGTLLPNLLGEWRRLWILLGLLSFCCS
jgi:hypothetical protein